MLLFQLFKWYSETQYRFNHEELPVIEEGNIISWKRRTLLFLRKTTNVNRQTY